MILKVVLDGLSMCIVEITQGYAVHRIEKNVVLTCISFLMND